MKRFTGVAMLFTVAMASMPAITPAEIPEFTPKITDVTVFKDGHALVLSRAATTFEDGWARTQRVPAPILGAFWTFVADENARVDFVSAAMVEKKEQRPALTFEEIIQANVGKQTTIVEQHGDADAIKHQGVLLGILEHESTEELEATERRPAGYNRLGRYVPEQRTRSTREEETKQLASFVMLRTETGAVIIKRENIQSIAFANQEPITTHTETKEVREVSIHVSGDAKPIDGRREIGMIYVQRGIRWIPDYRIELLKDGKAKVSLQGTIINELEDLEKVNLRLVVGVPSFIMKDDLSPVALREVGLQLGSYFAPARESGRGAQADYLSNVFMSQAAMPVAGREPPAGGGPAVPDEGQQEDLYLYQKPGITLKKGGRAVVQLLEITVPYEDVYKWDIPPIPPLEMWRHVNQNQQQELIRSLSGARAKHQVRLTNTGKEPWTLGPATIFKEGIALGQNVLPYTSVKNKADVTVTIATDLNTKKAETEVGRVDNVRIGGNDYTKVSLHGQLTLTSFKDKAVRVYVTRQVVGTATAATEGGEVVVGNIAEESFVGVDTYFWRWWSWPYWWYGVNAMSEVRWEIELAAGKSTILEYDYHYYLRR